MENKNLENLFRKKLGGMVIEPSMEANDKFTERLKKRREKIFFRRFSMAASILLLAVIGIMSFFPGNPEKDNPAVDQTAASSNPSTLLGEKRNNISPDMDEHPQPEKIKEDEMVLKKGDFKDGSAETTDTEIPKETMPVLAARNKADMKSLNNRTSEAPGNLSVDNEHGEFQAADNGQAVVNTIADPAFQESLAKAEESESGDNLTAESTGNQELDAEPVKITIEYIASSSKNEGSRTKLREFYSKIDNMKGVDEMIGDFREYKDRLFALEFKNENKVKDE